MKEYKKNYGGIEEDDMSEEAVMGFFIVGVIVITIITILFFNI